MTVAIGWNDGGNEGNPWTLTMGVGRKKDFNKKPPRARITKRWTRGTQSGRKAPVKVKTEGNQRPLLIMTLRTKISGALWQNRGD